MQLHAAHEQGQKEAKVLSEIQTQAYIIGIDFMPAPLPTASAPATAVPTPAPNSDSSWTRYELNDGASTAGAASAGAAGTAASGGRQQMSDEALVSKLRADLSFLHHVLNIKRHSSSSNATVRSIAACLGRPPLVAASSALDASAIRLCRTPQDNATLAAITCLWTHWCSVCAERR
jgi:hypothetical protein